MKRVAKTMVNFCAAIGCGNRGNRDRSKSFFRLPSVILHQGQRTYELSKKRQEVWLSRLNRSDIKPESYAHTRVCSDHFVTGMPSKLYDSTHPDWAPSQKLGYRRLSSDGDRSRHERTLKRSTIKNQPVEEDERSKECLEELECVSGVEVQTTLTSSDIAQMEEEVGKSVLSSSLREQELEEKVACLQKELDERVAGMETEIQDLKKASDLNEDGFRDDDEKVKFYTGISTWQVFCVLFTYIRSHLKQRSKLNSYW